MKRALLSLIFFAGALAGAPAQTFDSEYQAAQTALVNLDAAAEARVQQDIESLAGANATIAQQNTEITDLKSQIAALQAPQVFDRLEYGPWKTNCAAAVGGSGQAAGAWTPPGIETAQQSITPAPNNYGDCYFSQDFGPHNSLTKFSYTLSFLFPSAADAASSQALEFEVKQPVGGLMFAAGIQLCFACQQIRFFNYGPAGAYPHGWIAVPGITLARFTPGQWYSITLEAHRDSGSYFYDAITVSSAGTAIVPRAPIAVSIPAAATTWTDNLIIATQLDGNGKGAAYRVKLEDPRVTAQ